MGHHPDEEMHSEAQGDDIIEHDTENFGQPMIDENVSMTNSSNRRESDRQQSEPGSSGSSSGFIMDDNDPNAQNKIRDFVAPVFEGGNKNSSSAKL